MEEGCKRDFSLVSETVGTNETKLNEKKRERKRADDDEVDDIKSPRILGNIFLTSMRFIKVSYSVQIFLSMDEKESYIFIRCVIDLLEA